MSLHRFADSFRSTVSQWTKPPTTSRFEADGVLTPQEFVEAGDFLVTRFPTWRWMAGKKKVSWLPAEKQYLMTCSVPCRGRVSDLGGGVMSDAPEAPGWFLPTLPREAHLEECEKDVEEFLEDSNENYFVHVAEDENSDLQRTYDISITYDKYYQTPRIWLFGYDEDGMALRHTSVFEDFVGSYVKSTVTVDPHPHTGVLSVSIHPCKHAAVMRKVVRYWQEKEMEIRPDLALMVILKFVQSVIPVVDYDFTMDVDMGMR